MEETKIDLRREILVKKKQAKKSVKPEFGKITETLERIGIE